MVLDYNPTPISHALYCPSSTSATYAPSAILLSLSESVKRTLCTEELSRDVEGLSSDDNDLLAFEKLLSNSTGQATKEMTLAIDGDL